MKEKEKEKGEEGGGGLRGATCFCFCLSGVTGDQENMGKETWDWPGESQFSSCQCQGSDPCQPGELAWDTPEWSAPV